MNSAPFYEKIHLEYYIILIKLIQYYKDYPKDGKTSELLLENFTSEQIDVPNTQLDLEPIFVKVKDIKTCKSLIDLTLQLLSESIPMNSIQIEKSIPDCKELFTQVLYMLGNYSIDLKFISLKFFSDLITNYDQVALFRFQCTFTEVFSDLLLCLEALVKSMEIFHDKGEVDVVYLENFSKLTLNLLKITERNLEAEYNDMLVTICTNILNTNNNNIFSKELRLYCLSLNRILEFPEHITDIQNMDSIEIELLTECYCQNILSHIESCKQSAKTIKLTDNRYYNKTMCVIKTLKSCEFETDSFLIEYHLRRCWSALNILQNVYIAGKKSFTKTDLSCILGKEDTEFLWKILSSVIKYNQNMLLQNNASTKLVYDIILGTLTVCDNITRDNTSYIYQLLCLQTTSQFSENSLESNEQVKPLLLKYLATSKAILKKKVPEVLFKNSLTFLLSSLIRNKSISMYKEVSEFK